VLDEPTGEPTFSCWFTTSMFEWCTRQRVSFSENSPSIHRRPTTEQGLQKDQLGPSRAELRVRHVAYVLTHDIVEVMGLEPTTPCLQSRCSSQLSYTPVEFLP
jgi:hypothetical protein